MGCFNTCRGEGSLEKSSTSAAGEILATIPGLAGAEKEPAYIAPVVAFDDVRHALVRGIAVQLTAEGTVGLLGHVGTARVIAKGSIVGVFATGTVGVGVNLVGSCFFTMKSCHL
jgi:hypothetical protein